MAVQTTSGLSDLQRTSYNRVLLSRALPYTPGFRDGRKASIPRNEGTTMEWRILGGSTVATTGAGLALATTALTEGVPPSDTALTAAKITKAVAQHGAFVKASDLLVHQSIDPVWSEIFALLGEQAGQTLHTLLMNDLAGGTNVQYASTATAQNQLTASMIMTGAEVREAVRTLARAKAERFADGFYHGIIHVNGAYDLRNDADFKNAQIYNGARIDGNNSMISGEIRDWEGVRFLVTTDAPYLGTVGASSAPVYATLIYGRGWFGTVDLAAQPMGNVNDMGASGLRIRAVPVEQETKDDPLGQFGVAGWKTTYGGKILQQWRGVRIEHGVTA